MKPSDLRLDSRWSGRDPVTQGVIGAAIAVHRALGPGLLEHAYKECLAHEFRHRGISFAREVPIAVQYGDCRVSLAYRVDFVIEGVAAVEVKAVTALAQVHHAQLLTYLRLGGWSRGLLLNFWVPRMKDGIVRYVF